MRLDVGATVAIFSFPLPCSMLFGMALINVDLRISSCEVANSYE